jgi:DNA polymerase III, delta subunit
MKSINEDIKNNDYKGAYLLYGEEAYLKKQYKEKLLKALNPDADMMNVSYFEGKGIDPRKIIDLAETIPFLAERRIIIIENSGFCKGQCDGLPEYLDELPEYLCLVFVECEVDKRSRMYKAVNKHGRVTEFTIQDDRRLMQWVLGIISKDNKKITQKDMELLLSKTGNDMGNIEKEVEKLLCYTIGKDVITGEDIEAICTTQISNKIFDMIKAMSERRQQRALELYYDLLSLKEPPMRILFLMSRQFNLILQAKELAESGYSPNDMARKMGVQSFVVRNYQNFARQYQRQQLRAALEEFVSTEEDVKSGRLNDVISVELLLIKYSK